MGVMSFQIIHASDISCSMDPHQLVKNEISLVHMRAARLSLIGMMMIGAAQIGLRDRYHFSHKIATSTLLGSGA